MPAEVWKGAPVAEALSENLKTRIAALAEKGVVPCLGMIRIGERPGDLSYERSATKRCASLGIAIEKHVLPAGVTEDELICLIKRMNADSAIHGILFFRPLPEGMDVRKVCDVIAPEKDVDGITSRSMAAVYAGEEHGFFPCTAQAVIEMLRYYDFPIRGKRAVVVGRSLVTGRPAALLLLREHRDMRLDIVLRHIDAEALRCFRRIAEDALQDLPSDYPQDIAGEARTGPYTLHVYYLSNPEGVWPIWPFYAFSKEEDGAEYPAEPQPSYREWYRSAGIDVRTMDEAEEGIIACYETFGIAADHWNDPSISWTLLQP